MLNTFRLRDTFLGLLLALQATACFDTTAPPSEPSGGLTGGTSGTGTGSSLGSGGAASTGAVSIVSSFAPTTSSFVFAAENGTATDFEHAALDETLGTGDLTVLMVVDRSGSMSGYFDGIPKWAAAQSALSSAVDEVGDALTIGALLFPQGGDCDVAPLDHSTQIQFQRGTDFKARWETSNVALPSGGTPLGLAFQRADQALAYADESGLLSRRFRLVLVTDGEPTCGEDPEALVRQTDAWRTRGIDVEVMGLPGSESAALLLHRLAGLDPADFVPGTTNTDSSWTSTIDTDSGYVAPQDQGDVDDSFSVVVK